MVPPPILFNVWKHHAGWIREQVVLASAHGENGMLELARQLVVVGQELMDLYFGALSPHAIAFEILANLTATDHLTLPACQTWLHANSGYQVVTASDESQWVLRLGAEPDRYVHVHPGRWTPQTRRVRAKVLKTAVMALAYAAATGRSVDVGMVNEVRKQYLGLSPIPKISDREGLGELLWLLRSGSPLPLGESG